MGFDDGRIELHSENGVYYPGGTINGRIIFDQKKDKTIHGIYVSFKGFCKVHWTTRKSRRVNDRTEYYTVDHTSYEEYIKKKIFVIGHSEGEHHIEAGEHAFDFNFHIPDDCPSSFEGSDGHIRYRIKAVMVTSGMFSLNKELSAPVRVVAQTNLNDDSDAKEPMEFEIYKSYCCWCFNSGSSELRVKLPASGYCPGQIIPIEVSCENNSTVEIKRIIFAIKRDGQRFMAPIAILWIQRINFTAASAPDTRHSTETVAEIKKGPVPGNTTRNWTVEMEVPEMDVYNLNACRYIDIDYKFKVSTDVSGCHTDQDESQPIIIGTVPLQGYQDENPHQNLMPKQTAQVASYHPSPIVNQPLPSYPYPNNQPYVNPVSPYPLGNPNGSPYPQANQPYPGHTPNQNISPYPQTNQGYPGTPNQNVSPYPQTNPPYPSVNPPYPIVNPPYPGHSPVPPQGGNTPSSVSPYPDKRAVTSSSMLKTGTIGFTMPGGPPLPPGGPPLPPGANVPYPLSPANMYAGASAPGPATPDSVNNNPADISPAEFSNPPYNPEFMNEQNKLNK